MYFFMLTEKETGSFVNLVVPDIKTRKQAKAFFKQNCTAYFYHYCSYFDCPVDKSPETVIKDWGISGITITKEQLKECKKKNASK